MVSRSYLLPLSKNRENPHFTTAILLRPFYDVSTPKGCLSTTQELKLHQTHFKYQIIDSVTKCLQNQQ